MTDATTDEEWPGLEPPHELYQEPTTFDEWKKGLEWSVKYRNALLELKDEKRDPEQIEQLLFRVYRSREWASISKPQVDRGLRSLEEVRSFVTCLRESEFFRHVIPKRTIADQLRCELEWFENRLRKTRDHVTGHQHPRSDDALSKLLTYIRGRTGNYRYAVVTRLLEESAHFYGAPGFLRKRVERLKKQGLLTGPD